MECGYQFYVLVSTGVSVCLSLHTVQYTQTAEDT